MNIQKVAILLFVIWMAVIPLFSRVMIKEDIRKEGFNFSDKVLVYDKSSKKVLKLTPEEFIIGAIGVEMPATYNHDALVAQGIASYSYLRYGQLAGGTENGGYIDVDTDHFIGYTDKKHLKEAYGSAFPDLYPLIVEAAQIAQNYIMTYEGLPILAAYHAISNGSTEAAENVWQQSLPYLKPVDSSFDRKAQGYESVMMFSASELMGHILKVLPNALLPEDPRQWIKIVSRTGSGYIDKVIIGGVETKGSVLRQILSARSSDIELAYTDSGQFVFTVYGYGHGVGMSQVGAEYMATLGRRFDDILYYYYTDAELTQIKSS